MKKWKVQWLDEGSEVQIAEVEAVNLEEALKSTECPSDPNAIISCHEIVEDPYLGLGEWCIETSEHVDTLEEAAASLEMKTKALSVEQKALLTEMDPELLPLTDTLITAIAENLGDVSEAFTDFTTEMEVE